MRSSSLRIHSGKSHVTRRIGAGIDVDWGDSTEPTKLETSAHDEGDVDGPAESGHMK